MYPVVGINLDYIRYTDDTLPDGYALLKNPSAVFHFVKMVREKFPTLKLSADVMAGKDRRKELGQEDILSYLDLTMPMMYTYSGIGGPADIITYGLEITRHGRIIPDLRGWNDNITDPRSKGLVADLGLDIAAVNDINLDGFALFTYEALLVQSGSKSLANLKEKLGLK